MFVHMHVCVYVGKSGPSWISRWCRLWKRQ